MQLELPGMEGYELMEAARKWVRQHCEEWSWYKSNAARECGLNGKASPNTCLSDMRRRFRVSVPNDYAPCLARIAMEQDSSLRFRLAKSRVDGYTKARLR